MSNTLSMRDGREHRLLGLAPLFRMAFDGEDLRPVQAALAERAARHPDDGNALLDLSTVLQLGQQRELALAVQAEALAVQRLYRLPAATARPGLRLLALMAPGDLMANVPFEFLLEGSDVDVSMLYVGCGMPLPGQVPDHDVLLVALSESDANLPVLEDLAVRLASWPCRVLNRPDRVARLARDRVSALLKTVPGVVIPTTYRAPRASLEAIAAASATPSSVGADLDLPAVVRPVDSHAGHDFARVETPDDLAVYLRATPAAEHYVARFVDYRGADGLYRKYRIVLIEGEPYACHAGISENWMIHYLNAGMTESAAKRAEEARFFETFDDEFVPRHAEALRAICEQFGLDYVGIDCAETAENHLLVFEVDHAMVVHALDPPDLFPYKRPQMERVFAAFRRMLDDRCRPSPAR